MDDYPNLWGACGAVHAFRGRIQANRVNLDDREYGSGNATSAGPKPSAKKGVRHRRVIALANLPHSLL
jgi:hypothetical protein